MQWNHLNNQTLKSVFYLDENNESGVWLYRQQIHLIEGGNIYFELENGAVLEVYISDDLEINQIKQSFKNSLPNDIINNHGCWSRISKKRIFKVKTYQTNQFVTSNDKTHSQEIIATVELIFTNGERVFISNAGFAEKDILESLGGDLVVYTKKDIGVQLNLI